MNRNKLKIKIFSDGADKRNMVEMYEKEFIRGLTTNPTLMKQAGIKDYKSFCLDILKIVKKKPISFEVFSDNFESMEKQALEISKWGENVYVKIPITNTKGESCINSVKKLSSMGIKVNVTAIMTVAQVRSVVEVLNPKIESYISIFAGRIADTGVDPINTMKQALKIMKSQPKSELIWASPRELLNIFQGDQIGCHIITVTNDIIKKLNMIGYDLDAYSLDTVKMFYNDSVLAGYKL